MSNSLLSRSPSKGFIWLLSFFFFIQAVGVAFLIWEYTKQKKLIESQQVIIDALKEGKGFSNKITSLEESIQGLKRNIEPLDRTINTAENALFYALSGSILSSNFYRHLFITTSKRLEKERYDGKNRIALPQHGTIYQHHASHADIPYSVTSGYRVKIKLVNQDTGKTVFQSSNPEGIIRNVPIGLYTLYADKSMATLGVGDVYVVAGQSNAVSGAQMHPLLSSQTEHVSLNNVFLDYSGSNIIPKNDLTLFFPTPELPAIGSICWIYLGDAIYAKHQIPTLFVNIAAGGTSTNQWAPRKSDTQTQKFALIHRITEVLKKHKAKAVLWHQGETDFKLAMPEEDAFSNLKEIIQFSKNIQPDLDWFVAINSNQHGVARDKVGILNAEKKIIKEGLAYQGPSTDPLRLNKDFVEPSGAEFVGPGLKAHGDAWYEVLSKRYYN